jgi:DNA-binding CsgD family transcriptional regulator
MNRTGNRGGGDPPKTERNAAIVAAVKAGATQAAVAAAHALTESRVHQIVARAGVRGGRTARRVEAMEEERMLELARRGRSPLRIARDLGRPRATVVAVLQRHGWRWR